MQHPTAGLAPDAQPDPPMPDFVWPTHGFYHTTDSALSSLMRAGIAPDRITIKKVGRGWAAAKVVEQLPVVNKPLAPNQTIELQVEGENVFYHLPTGMREGVAEGQIGLEELAALFDDPVEKAAFFVRQGGWYFALHPQNYLGCARWLRLFGVEPESWPRERWYPLALLLPQLHSCAGREDGLRLALKLLLKLEIEAMHWRPRTIHLKAAECSYLGDQSTRLGLDLILGDAVAEEPALEITVGPVGLSNYRHWAETLEGQHLVQQTFRLMMPYDQAYTIAWLVGDRTCAPRLGTEKDNAILGINSHLGWN